MKSVQPLLEAFGGFWKRCRYWYRLLEPARASLLVSLVVPVTFIFVDQGRDSLRRIASDPTAALGSVSFTAIAMLLAPESGEHLRTQIRSRGEGFFSDVQHAADERKIELRQHLDSMRAPREM